MGSEVKVAVPKQHGSNQIFRGSAPVFLTAPQEITLRKYGKVVKETEQMQKRIRYFADQRREVLKVCPRCGARLYLEGKTSLDNPASSSVQAADSAADGLSGPPPPKRPRLTDDAVRQLKDAKDLLDLGILLQVEFEELKAKVLAAV